MKSMPEVHCAHDRMVPLEEIKPNPRNPNFHPEKQIALLARIIASHGWRTPITVSTRSGFIVRGHGRYESARLLKCAEVPVDFQDYASDEEEWQDLLADNRIAELSQIDESILRGILQDFNLDIELTGYDFDYVQDLLAEDDKELREDGFDGAAEAAKIETPISRPGDLYLLGDHRLMCGESNDRAAMAFLMDGRLADLVWTDPPYNVDYHNERGEGLENDNLPPKVFSEMITAAFRNICLHTREGGCIYVSHSDVGGVTFRNALIESGFLLKQCLIWVKSGAVLGRQDYNWKHELILYGWKPGRAHYFCMDYSLTTVIDEDVDISKLKREALVDLVKEMRKCQATTVLREDRPSKNPLHPTQKPIALVGRMIRNSTPNRPGILVLDGFGGSGTTLMACEQMGRACNMMEKDPVYCDVIVKRWEQFTEKKAELLRDREEMAQ